jgi:nicotinate-nucleotide--dimethylbenzimidazole phosphoribosyltransferase
LLASLSAAIVPPDAVARAAAAARQDRLTKPTGALGRLEELSIWAAGVQGRCPPEPFRDIRVLLLAADHGIAAHGVSAYPSEVTAQMVANFMRGGAAVNALARSVGATVAVFDIAVDGDVGGADARWKVRRGTGAIDREDALSDPEFDAAVRAGVAIADEAASGGAALVLPGDMGIGSTTACAAVVAALLGLEGAQVTGHGTGVDDAGWKRKVTAVEDALSRLGPDREPLSVVRRVGGADIAAMSALLVAAAARRIPVVLDGVVSCTAALVAARVAPAAVSWWCAGHRSTEPAQQAALEALGLTPIVDLGLRLGEGTGALAAVPLLQVAVAALRDMATFAEAGVSDRDG